ncbi:MAG: class I SAM-dependent methyltransferase [Proteobacteria bacterium]|nr:class I SAM-dependent methyltransferase [Pseudomonadota bacterium]
MTRWDGSAVDHYEAWFESSQGSFALVQERRLLERLASPWPRRANTLLDIGCGPGIFMKLFWEMGFDVTGLDAAPDMLGAARRRLGPHASYHLGKAEHLPFADDEFDYATLLTVLEFCEDPLQALREAKRVAKYGLIVGFLNRYSLYRHERTTCWPWKGGGGTLIEAHWYSCLEMRRLISEALGNKPVKCGSVLPGPVWTWRPDAPWSWLNGPVYPLGLGAYGAIRVDFAGQRPLTPLYSFAKSTA